MTEYVCGLCWDPKVETHRYRTGFTVSYLCDECAKRLHMENCRKDQDDLWFYPTYDMKRRE